MKLYIGNLAWACTEQDLEQFFFPYGVKLGSTRVVRDRETGRGKGFGFIELDRGADALKEMDGRELLGRPVRLATATQQAPTRRF